MAFKNPFTCFFRNERGNAAIEFAFLLPILFTMFMGVVETSNVILANQRTDKMASVVADLVTQYQTIATSDLDTILAATSDIMIPFPFGSRGLVIITSVYQAPGGTPKVVWQYQGGGTLQNVNSNFGSTGFGSPLPSGFTLNDGETVIIAEVYYNYPPLISDMFVVGSNQLYKYAFYKPRIGALNTLTP